MPAPLIESLAAKDGPVKLSLPARLPIFSTRPRLARTWLEGERSSGHRDVRGTSEEDAPERVHAEDDLRQVLLFVQVDRLKDKVLWQADEGRLRKVEEEDDVVGMAPLELRMLEVGGGQNMGGQPAAQGGRERRGGGDESARFTARDAPQRSARPS